MTPAERLLSCLDGIRETGPGKWLAKCPAHDDRSPSLSIRQTSDGVLLVNCFAGCDAGAVIDACGLTFADLFPDRTKESEGRRHQPDYRALMLSLSREAWVVLCAAVDTIGGKPLSGADLERLLQARHRLDRFLEVAGVRTSI